MNSLTLRAKLIIATGLIFVVLSFISSAILYNAQSRQAAAEMDTVLTNEALALSALVNSRPHGQFDFEISNAFAAQYVSLRPGSFFQFSDPTKRKVYLGTPNAPQISCQPTDNGKSTVLRFGESRLRYRTLVFAPQVDVDWKGPTDFVREQLCLIVGVDEKPYRALVFKTVATTIPLLLLVFGLLAAVLIILAQRIVNDLSTLAKTIETADFGATHEFPELPEVDTVEVKAVADKLRDLHRQASDVYKEMWLFLGRAAHQIKTPVAAMQATLDVLLRRERSKDELLSGLADVKLAANSLSNLTRKLISSSRVAYHSAPAAEPIRISEFFNKQITAFSALANSRNVILKLEGDESLEIESDIDLLSEIFGNLIENAVLYSAAREGADVQIVWHHIGQHVRFVISNSGAAIPENVKRNLGSPFVRGDERQVFGSGLGLSIVMRATNLLYGELDIVSDLSGTHITLTLPQSALSKRR